jgi:thioredoxin 1
MVFRDQIVLYAQPGAIPGNMLESLITQVNELDMDQVRAQIAQEQEHDHSDHDHADHGDHEHADDHEHAH